MESLVLYQILQKDGPALSAEAFFDHRSFSKVGMNSERAFNSSQP
jgi:hypothetical protein